jgi:hypothetical protein
MEKYTAGRSISRVSRFGVVLCAFAVLCFSLLATPRQLRAESPAGGLTDDQQATLTAGLAEKKSYAALIAQAVKDGMPIDEVVVFLCAKAGNAPAAVDEIVYAAVAGTSDDATLVTAAGKAGAPLGTVLTAALSAGGHKQAISEAAMAGGASAEDIANVFAGTAGGGMGGQGGGEGGGGGLGGGVGGGAGGLGGGAGGGVGGGTHQASPHKP